MNPMVKIVLQAGARLTEYDDPTDSTNQTHYQQEPVERWMLSEKVLDTGKYKQLNKGQQLKNKSSGIAVPHIYYDSFGMGLLIAIFEKSKRKEEKFEISRNMSVDFFKTELGFHVLEYKDGQDLSKFLDEVKTYVKRNSWKHYCLFFLICCHGDKETFVIGDNNMDFLEMRNMFKNENFKEFSGRPKIFIADFCRGAAEEKAVPMSCAPTKSKSVNLDADMMVVYATTPGKAAWMTTSGSLLHKVLIEILRRHWKKSNLYDMVLRVQNKVHNWAGSEEERQTVELSTTLTKTFAFRGAKVQ